MDTYNHQHALELLRLGSGRDDANFREGQEDAIRHIAEGRSRLLVVQKTGWGKSFVYFIATKLLREAGHGPALLVSPLLALMRNQIAAAERIGVRATSINSDNQDDWEGIEEKLNRDETDILLISPERLANGRFRSQVLAGIAARISLLVIDEAHCISDWGHDFRPHYRLLERIVKTLPPNLRLLATTATANNRVMDDLMAVLGPNLEVSRGDLTRAAYFDAGAWKAADALAGAPEALFTLGAPESSVHWDADRGQFAMVQSEGFGATTLAVRFAPEAQGPWSAPATFYRPPESYDENAFVYAGKAHPEVAGGGLAVSYVPSRFEDDPRPTPTDFYFPHFVRVRF